MSSDHSNAEHVIRCIQELGGTVVWERELCAVMLSGTTMMDDELAVLVNLPMVELIDLSNTPITDAGIRHLTSLKSVKTIVLSGTSVTREGIKHLRHELPTTEIVMSRGDT